MSERPLNICLIRSGETDWDLDERCQGTGNLPLSAEGIKQSATRCSQWLPHPTIRTIYCGPDEASLHTARLFAQCGRSIKTRPLSDLLEVDMGLWQGLRRSELADRYPKAHACWEDDPTQCTAPGGESGREALRRLKGVIRKRSRRTSDPQAIGLTLVLRPVLMKIALHHLCNQNRPMQMDQTTGSWIFGPCHNHPHQQSELGRLSA
ncbi:MAG: histidine phosphatase family protein [Phycisphaeraceae bacterium]|nr:histidine phosphatase family protein [Phycisphaeraceae bacterium]